MKKNKHQIKKESEKELVCWNYSHLKVCFITLFVCICMLVYYCIHSSNKKELERMTNSFYSYTTSQYTKDLVDHSSTISISDVLQSTEQKIYSVFVCGAVACPDVYELEAGSNYKDAILAAGGFLEDANRSYLNLAKTIQNEEKIYVPWIGELVTEVKEDGSTGGKVNLNLATLEELMTLPGIGQSRAESIIQYRKEHGFFKTIEDVMLVSGIKEAAFQKIRDYISVEVGG